jgi:hypothetical protein
VEFRFELITPLRVWGSEGYTEEYTWRNVVVTWADSGHWHTDEYLTDGGTVPESHSQWNLTDGFAVPSTTGSGKLYPSEVRTNRGDGQVEVEIPKLPLIKVGSKVLVQPKGVGFMLVAGYQKVTDMFFPKSGQRDRYERKSNFRVNQRELPAEDVIAVDESTPDEYAGLPPEVVASLKMMDAATANAGDESEEDQMTIMGLKMDGFVDFDGSTVSGSRAWTTTAADLDEEMTVSHELSWSFVPQKGR